MLTATAPAAPVVVRAGAPAVTRPCPPQHTRGLVGALNAEWRAITAGDVATEAVAGWATREPVLSGHRDLEGVVDAAGRRGEDAVLLALLRLSRAGDELATRTALQVMLGAAVRLARRTLGHAHGDLEESLARAIAALWQVVREYPFERRSCRPADGISLDVLAALTGAGRPRLAEVPGGLAGELDDRADDAADEEAGARAAFWSLAHPPAVGACADEQLILLLAWGVRRSAVTVDDARLLMRLHSPADPGTATSCRDVADELGLGHAAVRQRASRATRRLAAAVAAHSEEDAHPSRAA